IVAAQPALLAHHCTEAGLIDKAVGYWLKAGQQSVARSAMTEAVGQLQRGLNLLTGLPDGLGRKQLELDLLIALGRALMAIRGFGAFEVGEILGRAQSLAEQLDRSDCLVAVLYGRYPFHLLRAEYQLAHTVAVQMKSL